MLLFKLNNLLACLLTRLSALNKTIINQLDVDSGSRVTALPTEQVWSRENVAN